MPGFGRIADVKWADGGQEKPATWPGFRFPGSGGVIALAPVGLSYVGRLRRHSGVCCSYSTHTRSLEMTTLLVCWIFREPSEDVIDFRYKLAGSPRDVMRCIRHLHKYRIDAANPEGAV